MKSKYDIKNEDHNLLYTFFSNLTNCANLRLVLKYMKRVKLITNTPVKI